MNTYVLIIAIMTNVGLTPIIEFSGAAYPTQSACQAAANHPAVIGTYQDLLPDNDVVFVCAEIKKPKTVHEVPR